MKLPFISKPDEIPINDYHGEKFKEFCSSSTLKTFLTSPKKAKYWMDHPDEKPNTAALKFGSVYHDHLAAMTNGTDCNNWQIFEPPVNEKTGKPYGNTSRAWDEAMIEQAVPDKELCLKDDMDLVDTMINELLTGNPHLSKDINIFIKNGTAEESFFAEYQGCKFKVRTDVRTRNKIIDWKTCADGLAEPGVVERQIIKYGYHISAAMYQFFDHLITGKWRNFYWVFQEKSPPFDFLIVSAAEWAFDIQPDGKDQIAIPKVGAFLFIKLMEQYILCTEKNEYPGYSIFVREDWLKHRIYVPKIPAWHEYQASLKTFYN